MLTGDVKTIKMLDQLLQKNFRPVKDSSKDNGCGVYTKTYEVLSNNPHPTLIKVRVWLNEREDRGTIKIKKLPYGLVAMASSYTLVQAGLLVQQALIAPK